MSDFNDYGKEYEEHKTNLTNEPGRGDGEYRYIPQQRDAWSDAGYVPSKDAAAMPKSYSYAAPAQEKKEKNPQKARRGMPWAATVALCLVCAILGGAVGGWGLMQLQDRGVVEPESRAVVETDSLPAADSSASTSVASAGSAASVTTTQAVSGKEMSATDIYYNLAVNQVVAITTEITYTNAWGYTSSGAVKGSGFIISEDGYILTNYHVIEDAVKGGYNIEVLVYDGTEYIASVVGYEADNDVALLKIDAGGLSAVTVGNSDELMVGEAVYAVGNPLGELEFSMSDGIVSATDREITTSDSSTGRRITVNMFQTTAAINSGNSGGPVYNSRGEVVGIASAKYASSGVEGLAFAIPINDAIVIATDLITDGYVRGKANMGVTVGTVSASAAQYYGLVEGAIVNSVTAGSAADKAGLKESDIIVRLGDETVTSVSELNAAKKNYKAGDTATIRIYRSGAYLDLTITFDEEVPTAETDTQQENNQQQQQQNGLGGYRDYFDYFSHIFGNNPFG